MMTSRPIVPQQAREGLNQQPRKKTMVAGADNKNRRALGDIGNLAVYQENAPAAAIKQKPATLEAEVIVIDSDSEGPINNNKKRIAVNPPAAAKQAPPVAPKEVQKKPSAAVLKQKPTAPEAEVIIIDCDSEEPIKNDKSIKKKKKLQTFTSILATGSKSACKRDEKEESVFNIDASDANNHLAVTQYVDDIYSFYKLAENETRPSFYMETQPELTTRMRSILVDWLIDVHHKFDLSHETLYLTINIIDRFLSLKQVPRRELQLVGISATLTASKYEEIWPPEVNDLVLISDRAYTNTQILTMEKTILAHLEWTLTVPTQFVFLTRFVKAAEDRESLGHMAALYSELGLMDFECSVAFKPSMVAAAAVYAARWAMKRTPVWNRVLEFYTGYGEKEVLDCAKVLIELREKVKEGKLQAVVRKYSRPLKGSVALIAPPARN